MKHAISVSLPLLLSALVWACAPAYRPPPLSLGEKCANDGLIAGSSRGAEASGVVGRVFAGSGSTHSCERPTTMEHRCEVEANSRAAVAKQTYKAETSQVVAYANDVKWQSYNACMARNPGPISAAPQAAAPPVEAVPGPSTSSMQTVAPPPVAPASMPLVSASPDPASTAMPTPPPSTLDAYSNHRGFTGGFSLGFGQLDCSGCRGEGGASVGFYLGGFINPRTAILFEGNNWMEDPVVATLYSATARHWFSPKFWGSGGLGIGRVSISDSSFSGSDSGLGLTGGLGYDIVQSGSFTLDLGGHLNFISIDNDTLSYLTFLIGANWT